MFIMTELTAIILAAGKGKRMNSDLPKVLHLVGGRPMVVFSALTAQNLGCKKITLVVPKKYELIRQSVSSQLKKSATVKYAVQATPRGTGDAVRCAIEVAGLPKKGAVVIINGDMPLISPQSISNLLSTHHKSQAALTVLSALHDNLHYGRIRRSASGKILGIVEERDASEEELKIREVNVGVYACEAEFLSNAIYKLCDKNSQKEFYLTDLVEVALAEGLTVAAASVHDVGEALGANTPTELIHVNREYYGLRRRDLLLSGVTLNGNEVFVDAASSIGPGVNLESPCYVKGESIIESGVTIETGCVIKSSRIRSGSHLKAYCYLDQAVVEKDCHVGPFAHLRPDTHLMDNAKIGNFVETKKSVIGPGSKANHLSYIGDTRVGEHVNIGAGTITCNYDGVNKFKTVIEDGVFIGSDTQLVAPVKIGKGSFVGAGTTVTQDVKPYSLVITRVPQKEIPGWAKRDRKKPKS